MSSDSSLFRNPIETDLTPGEGWHCSHFFYSFDRAELADWEHYECQSACEELASTLSSDEMSQTARIQSGWCMGHKADWSLMVMDPDPLRVESVHQAVISSPLAAAIDCVDSYVSLTELSEYVMSEEQFGEHLQRQGFAVDSDEYQKRMKGYAGRLPAMNKQRLNPEFPEWPVSCFYPMNKTRSAGSNWFLAPFSDRQKMMGEHAQSGMRYAGKVTQLITVSVGLDDWEWGVTLWATNPLHLKQIVYDLRFDRASAQYAEFGRFYTSYIMSPMDVFERCNLFKGTD